MTSLFRFVAPLIAGLLFAIPAAAQDEKKEDKKDKPADPLEAMIGKPAPDFEGDFAINGKPTKLSDLKGKVVLVDFWAVWCGPCIATFPHLREWHKEYKDKGLEIVGVTMYNCELNRHYGFDKEAGKLTRIEKQTKEGEQELLKQFAEHHKLEHLLMTLPQEKLRKAFEEYHVRGIPHVVLVDREGIVQLVKVGAGEANARAIEAKIRELLAP